MSFRRKLLSVFALTVVLSVTIVVWIVSVVTRRAFERVDNDRTSALVAQFRREFDRRGHDVVRRVDAVASSDAASRMAQAVNQGPPDYGAFLNEARTIADEQDLDFLEFIDGHGTIISSAQWPAKFGYKGSSVPADVSLVKGALLRQQETPNGLVLGLSAIRKVNSAENPLYVIGGKRLDKDFLSTLELPAGMRVLFYQNLADSFSTRLLIDPSSTLQNPEKLEPLIELVKQQNQEATAIIHWTGDATGDEAVHAIPLRGDNNQILGVLLAGNARRSYVELRRYIRSAALLAAGGGLVLAILFSSWAAARVTRPVVHLADVAREVAAGNWYAQADVPSSDELGELADSFNRMTRKILDQRERLVQTERVAAWRELARRLAHELKNPLFPLQLTVENLLRARQQSPQQFEEIFQESSATLLQEIANLKTVIGRFSEFSRMPQPQLQQVNLNEIARNVARLFQAQLHSAGHSAIECKLDLSETLNPIEADPDLLHRAISNLVLNAMDAMPQGGVLTLKTRQEGDRIFLSVSDTGTGLTPEECERLFTPYYTSKTHGTGLGLAIVQSVVSDHHGRISVTSKPGGGTTFLIELPRIAATSAVAPAFANWKGIS